MDRQSAIEYLERKGKEVNEENIRKCIVSGKWAGEFKKHSEKIYSQLIQDAKSQDLWRYL